MRRDKLRFSERLHARKLELREGVKRWAVGCQEDFGSPMPLGVFNLNREEKERLGKWLFLERMIPETTSEGRGEVMAVLALVDDCGWRNVPRDATDRKKLLDRLSKLDAAVPGGLISLLKRMESEEREVN